jgi:hypothetical protein
MLTWLILVFAYGEDPARVIISSLDGPWGYLTEILVISRPRTWALYDQCLVCGDKHWKRVDRRQRSPPMEILDRWKVRNKSKSSNART